MALNSTLLTPEVMRRILDEPIQVWPSIVDLLPKPPKFRRPREVHAQRARKLRRRGEYLHFVRWQNGHCIYSWGGPTPQTFTFRMHPASQADGGGEHG
jgi:hypothetical protein